MDRKHRISARCNRPTVRLNASARAIDSIMREAGLGAAEKERFLGWAIKSLINTYKEERMNQRILIENEVKQLGLRFPNGTVKQAYSHSFPLPTDKFTTFGSKEPRRSD